MDGIDAALHRSSAAQPSSPIEFSADSVYARHLTGGANMNGNSNLSANASRLMTSPRPPASHVAASVMTAIEEPALHDSVNAHAALSPGIAPEEGELDQFDIVLQQDAAASSGNAQGPFRNRSPSNTGTHSPSGATPPLGVGGYAASTGSGGLVASAAHYTGGTGSNQRCSPSVLFQGAARRLPSVAGACQASAITQDRDQCARLIHQMASACRGELHLHGHSNSGGGSTTSVASPGGDPRATSSPAAQQTTTASVVSGLDPHIFEEELSLLTGIILEANMAHNPQWQPQFAYRSSHHASSSSNGGYVSPPHGMLRASPRNGGCSTQPLAAAPAAVTATMPASLLGTSTGVAARSHSRGSPAGGVPAAHLASSYLAGIQTSNINDGRSTIDTEVSDSLCRISHPGGGGGSSYHLYMMEHGVRPMNPCQGAPPLSGATGGGVRSISQLQQHQQAWTTLMHESFSNPGHLDRAAIANLSGQASRRPSGSAARSTSATVKHPRAVKPEVSSEGGRIRGPRSRTGKNVAPSNHSAFSECSGGETRSCRSTLTGAHRVLSSSANATTNTSLSSSVFHQIQVDHGMTMSSGNGRSSNA
ncbi:hypothetical protein LSCM1_05563 [Leishmania martiniquensis]|uniref:Uncharacterized protein n=1 Tax=Leishmania martiniquensis TaxID=1580590 RepID=A0A836GWQ9_9TRYP|nr:hypothetical protein LSCM1_05563 [Leishmania martiniquensis]